MCKGQKWRCFYDANSLVSNFINFTIPILCHGNQRFGIIGLELTVDKTILHHSCCMCFERIQILLMLCRNYFLCNRLRVDLSRYDKARNTSSVDRNVLIKLFIFIILQGLYNSC